MATYSPTVLIYPETFNGMVTGVIIKGTAGASSGEGVFDSIPVLSDTTNLIDVPIIPCAGFDELYFMPLGDAAGGTNTYYIYGIYGDRQSGGDNIQYHSKLIVTVTGTHLAGGLTYTTKNGTSFATKTTTKTDGFNTVLDSLIGCTSALQAGSSSSYGIVGIPHLGGADYIAVACVAGTGTFRANALVRFG